jgi:hypothetical protein
VDLIRIGIDRAFPPVQDARKSNVARSRIRESTEKPNR